MIVETCHILQLQNNPAHILFSSNFTICQLIPTATAKALHKVRTSGGTTGGRGTQKVRTATFYAQRLWIHLEQSTTTGPSSLAGTNLRPRSESFRMWNWCIPKKSYLSGAPVRRYRGQSTDKLASRCAADFSRSRVASSGKALFTRKFVEARAPQEGGSALGDPDGHSKMRGPAAIPALVLMALLLRLRLELGWIGLDNVGEKKHWKDCHKHCRPSRPWSADPVRTFCALIGSVEGAWDCSWCQHTDLFHKLGSKINCICKQNMELTNCFENEVQQLAATAPAVDCSGGGAQFRGLGLYMVPPWTGDYIPPSANVFHHISTPSFIMILDIVSSFLSFQIQNWKKHWKDCSTLVTAHFTCFYPSSFRSFNWCHATRLPFFKRPRALRPAAVRPANNRWFKANIGGFYAELHDLKPTWWAYNSI